MPTRHRPRRVLAAVLTALAVVALLTAAPASARSEHRSTTTTVRGGYLNEAGLLPAGAPTPGKQAGTYVVPFTGGSTWDGSFTGHTVIHGVATVLPDGSLRGTFTETFYGVYVPDGRSGSLTHTGTFVSDADLLFSVRSRIVGGTCGFAGSSGTFAFDGQSANGGYVGSWRQPVPRPQPPAVCTG